MEKNKIDIKYTLCFIKKDNEFLMLNRIKAPNMGLWNGVGEIGRASCRERVSSPV